MVMLVVFVSEYPSLDRAQLADRHFPFQVKLHIPQKEYVLLRILIALLPVGKAALAQQLRFVLSLPDHRVLFPIRGSLLQVLNRLLGLIVHCVRGTDLFGVVKPEIRHGFDIAQGAVPCLFALDFS